MLASTPTRPRPRLGDTGLLAMALLVGLATGCGAIGFRYLIEGLTWVLTGTRDYAATPGAHNGWLGWGPWFVVLTPVVTGLLYGPLVHRFASEARGHGVPEVMVAVARNGGRIPARVAAVKALASALTIGGGGSVGREGPIVQIGAALGSSLGGLLRVDEERRVLLVACGAAGGIAATFNAPLAGVVFAMEIVLRDFAARSFGMVVVSAVTASVVGRSVLGSQAFLDLPPLTVDHLATYALFATLGVVAGAAGVGFTRLLYAVEDLCDRVWRGPEWLRPAVGGVLLGLLLWAFPWVYGVGYPVLGDAVAGRYAVGFLLLLVAVKAVATSLTIGIGGSGGVFAPSLVLGAALGAAFGQTSAALAPGTTGSPGAFALVGMAALFAGAARAPITAVLIVFELTGEYSLILPLMAAVVLATGTSHLLSRDSIYTAKLRRRGVDLDAPPPWAAGRTVADVLTGERPPAQLPDGAPVVAPTTGVAEALDLLHAHGGDGLAVVEHGEVVGWFTSAGVLAALRHR